MKIIDLTHPVRESIPAYFPWHPPTVLERTASYAENSCVVTRLSIGTHTGTHIDAPSHIFEGMHTIGDSQNRVGQIFRPSGLLRDVSSARN